MIDLEELKKLARAATPGPWWIDSHGHAMVSHSEGEHSLALIFQADDRMGPAVRHESTGNLSHWRNDVDATYIAAANPAAILELIERLERAEQERGALQQTLASRSTCMGVGDGNGKLFVYGDYESIKAAQAMVLELERLRGFEQGLAKAEYRYEIAIRHANRRAEANKEMALTFSPPAKALSIFKTWWAMNEAEWELTGTVVSDSEIILHYSGCGASCHVTAGDIRELVSGGPKENHIKHPDDIAVDTFATMMKAKLAAARDRGRGGWDDPEQCSVDYLAELLGGHIMKNNEGNFVDIANFCMMLTLRGAHPDALRKYAIRAWRAALDDNLVDSTPEPTAPIERPHNCRNRLRDEGKPYPKSGCEHCKTGGLTGCPFEQGGAS